jgi:hypothetical protein
MARAAVMAPKLLLSRTFRERFYHNLGAESSAQKKPPSYRRYLDQLSAKKEALAKAEAEEREAFRRIREDCRRKAEIGKRLKMFAHHRRQLNVRVREDGQAELARTRSALAEKKAIREGAPFTSWTSYLRFRAEIGDETALILLRQKGKAGGEGQAASEPGQRGGTPPDEGAPLSAAAKKALADVAMMEEALRMVAVRNKEAFSMRLDFTVDSKGTIIYKFPGTGASIRDAGSHLYFTPNDKKCKEVAKQYADLRWGKADLGANKAGSRRHEREAGDQMEV